MNDESASRTSLTARKRRTGLVGNPTKVARATDSEHFTSPLITSDLSELTRRPISVSSSSTGSSVCSLDMVEEDSKSIVVDLTAEASDSEGVAVVDLTSPMCTQNRTRRTRTRHHRDDAILISGVEEDNDVIIVSSPAPPHPPPTTTPSTPPSYSATPLPTSPETRDITCPICLDSKRTFTAAGRSLVTTHCGHIFCDSCIKQSIQLMHKCPTCKKKLTLKQYHKIFI